MKVSERGQITIPQTLRKRYGFQKDVEIDLVPIKNGLLLQKRSQLTHPVDRVLGILKRPQETDTYIEKVRGR
jgi:bifunctional DNA-binding transcriptional regulator/antitoxin component of YhaV-PrlF toxin-antitoxin module